MKRLMHLILLLSAACLSALAQDRITVTGHVKDKEGEPLAGVNITVVGVAGFGTTTDRDGNYKINVAPYNRLVFQYLGFKDKEVLVKDEKVVDVVMDEDEATSLDAIVVTATGAEKKLTVTGAISSVEIDKLPAAGTSNLSNLLAGNVPGVLAMQSSGQPGRNTSEFWVRGISTFGAGKSALVLVDGFERSLDEISVEDIESFTVLKDASATAIYGSKGANGVVLINTKKGRSGKVEISAKFETSWNTRTFTPEYVDGYRYACLLNEALVTRNMEPEFQPEELEILRLGLDPDLYPNVDWQKVLLRNGATKNRGELNLSGGGNTARYFISGSYFNEGGMYKVDDQIKKDYNTNANSELYNYRMNVDVDITQTTLLKIGVSGSLRKINEPGIVNNIWEAMNNQNPIGIPVMYSDGRVPSSGTGVHSNPWVMATQTGYNEVWENKIQTNVTLEQRLDFITEGLRFLGRFGYDTNNHNNIRRFKYPEVYYASRKSGRRQDGSIIYQRIAEEQKMSQSSSASGDRQDAFEAELHYSRSFSGHHVSGTAKYTQHSSVATVNLGTDIINGIARRNQGLAGRIGYDWNYRYFVDFNVGYNGSENFANGHQFGFFPAFSLAWNVAEEPFIKKQVKWMNMFKIRFSHGKVGNDNLGSRFPYLYSIGQPSGEVSHGYNWADWDFNKYYAGLAYTQAASNNVTWEVATKTDLGVDLVLFHDKFSLTVDYFDENRDGIFMERRFLPAMVGLIGNPRANVGKVSIKGFDGNFACKQKFGQVNLTVRGNITYSKNRIIDRDEENTPYPYLLQKGYRVDQARGLVALGLFKDYDDIRNSPRQDFGTVQPGDIKYKDINGDGVVNNNDYVAIGATTRPNMIYGLGISASWKGIDVNVHFQGAGKSSFFINGPSVYAFSSGQTGNILKGLIDDGDRWIDREISKDPATENIDASYPRLTFGGNSNNYRPSTFWLKDGSYLRLKTLEIGYNLPSGWINKIHGKSVRLFFIGTNLLTFSKFKLWDPEMGSSNGTQYPLTKSVSMGLSINL